MGKLMVSLIVSNPDREAEEMVCDLLDRMGEDMDLNNIMVLSFPGNITDGTIVAVSEDG